MEGSRATQLSSSAIQQERRMSGMEGNMKSMRESGATAVVLEFSCMCVRTHTAGDTDSPSHSIRIFAPLACADPRQGLPP